MLKRGGRLIALCLASALALTPGSASAESLGDALASAYTGSGLLEQQRALLRARDENVAVAVAATRPVFNYALSYSNTSTYNSIAGSSDTATASATLSASLTLFDFGRTHRNIDLARENVLMARETLAGVEQKVLLRAVKAFLDVRSAHETAMLQANNVRILTQQLRATRDRFEVGEVTQTDVSLSEAALAAARSAEAAARGQLMIAREEYKAAVGHYPNGLTVPPAPPMTVRSLDEARALARKNHPDVKAAQRAVKVSEISADIARLGMFPSVTADASFTKFRNEPTAIPDLMSNAKVGVTLSGPIYQGGRLSALYRQAKAQLEASRADLHVTVQNVEQQVANAWAQLAVAAASLRASDQQIRASSVALRGAREEAELGARTTLEVLTFEQDLLNARAAKISAESDQYLAVYNLLAAMGLLTAEHLKLGVPIYDPEAYYNAVQNAPVYDISPQGERLDAMLKAIGRP
ncbi:MAG: transporter [Alphaproteobacteria bacterium]|nr:MAG: transporter [Alphaproteobacteria bacterium]